MAQGIRIRLLGRRAWSAAGGAAGPWTPKPVRADGAQKGRGDAILELIQDAEHIAAATVAGVSVLSSWNFRHMVNFWRIQRYN